jgi:hypothetical protein
MTKTTTRSPVELLYKAPKGTVVFLDVPELGFAMVDGTGAPESGGFADALHALYAVSYGAHFAVKKAVGEAPRVMALEALWWIEGAGAAEAMARMAAGSAGGAAGDRDRWRWRAMIPQLPPIDAARVEAAIGAAKDKATLKGEPNPALDLVRYERWVEGPSAQILHVGPYATEPESIAVLHGAIAEHGARLRGHHHEIYLGDPRTCAPERLRTILRQPIEPAP